MGWFGTQRELDYYLSLMNADRDESGKFCIYRAPICVGLDGDVAIPEETEYSVGGERKRLASGLAGTSYGIAVKVF